jgi:hypothetical protein
MSNFGNALDVLPADSGVTTAPPSSPAPSEAGPKSPELPNVIGRAASEVAHSFPNVAARTSTAPTQFSTASALVSTAPTVLVSLTPVSLTPASPTPASAESQIHAPIPTGATIFVLHQSPTVQSSFVPTASFTPAPSAPATPFTTAEASSVLNHSSDQPVLSSAQNQIPLSSTNPVLNMATPTSPAPTPTPSSTQPLPLQSPVSDNYLAPVTEPAKAKQPAAPKPDDSSVSASTAGNSTPNNPTPNNPTLGDPIPHNHTAAKPAPPSGSARLDIAPALSSDATTPAAAPHASAPETGSAVANNLTNNNAASLTSNLTPNSKAPASIAARNDAPSKGESGVSVQTAPPEPLQTTATVAAQTVSARETGFALADNLTTNIANSTSNNSAPVITANGTPNSSTVAPISTIGNDAPSNGKPGVAAQPPPAATPLTAADKKSSVAVQASATPSHATPSHAAASHIAASHVDASALASGKESPATLNAPAPPVSAPPRQAKSDPAPELPKVHQMLDSAPPVPRAPRLAPIATDPAAEIQMNAQMHVGIRTDAFGAVEIHTVVQQSQVGISVHGDRDLARWFSSEVPGLESGLNKNHLNLTAVDCDNGRSGIQTATSFQHGQPRQHLSETPGFQSAALPDQDKAPESVIVGLPPSDLYVGPTKTHVSIHV